MNSLKCKINLIQNVDFFFVENEWVDVIPTPPPATEKPKPKKAFVPATTPTPVQQFEILPPSNAVNHPAPVSIHDPSAIIPMTHVATLPTPSALLPGPTVFPQPVVEVIITILNKIQSPVFFNLNKKKQFYFIFRTWILEVLFHNVLLQ